MIARKPTGPNAEETQASQELQAVREGGGRGWGEGRGCARLTIQSGLPVGSHSQEGLGENPGQMQKREEWADDKRKLRKKLFVECVLNRDSSTGFR